MSTFVRRAEFYDVPSVQKIVDEEGETLCKRFGHFDVTSLVEMAMLCIVAVNEAGAVVGFAAFHDHPAGMTGVAASDWPDWLHTYFGHGHFNAANVTWLSYFVCDPTVHTEVAENVLRTAFTTMPEVDAVLMALPVDVKPFLPLRDTFDQLEPKVAAAVPYNVSLCPRALYLDKLHIRKARVEDHDDLVPIFEMQSEVLTERYGEYFIAQMIESQDEENKALVAEVEGRAVGLLALSSEIDVNTLQASFDLEAFDGLVTADEDELVAAEKARARADEAERAAKDARAVIPPDESPTLDEGEEGDEALAERETAARFEARRSAVAAAAKAAEEAAVAEAEAVAAEAAITYTCEAVAISLFCIDDSFESRSRDFLAGVFAAYPEKKYVLLTVPHATAEFPLLATFQQIEPRPASAFDHVLYLFHRDAMLSPALKLRLASPADADRVSELTGELINAEEIGDFFAEATRMVDDSSKLAYVVECSEQVVGLILLDAAVDVPSVQSLYRLEDFILLAEHEPRQHIELQTFVLNPIFSASSRFLLREVMRMRMASCIYYKITPETPVPDVLREFVQLKPRPQVCVPPSIQRELEDDGEVQVPSGTFARHALFLITRKMIGEPKSINNSRIVVMGSSDASIALLETLTSVPYLYFSSLHLVAPKANQRLRAPRGAFSQVADPDEALDADADAFFSRECSYTPAEVAALNLGARVQIIEGRMLDIDREGKAIVMADETMVKYDYLVLAPELGDQSLRGFGQEVTALRGAYSISDEEAAAAALEHVDELQLKGESSAPIVVYGGSLDAYCAIRTLLSRGVPAADVTLVSPPTSGGIVAGEPFGDEKIVSRVDERLAELGVRVRRGVALVGVEADEGKRGVLGSIQLAPTTDAEFDSMPCRTLLCCAEPMLDRATFRALNDNSIVFDGGLIVDSWFRTNDHAIYAAGPLTKLARRLRTKGKPVAPSGRETGTKLAQALLQALDPLAAQSEHGSTEAPARFFEPVSVGADLPGGLFYYRVSKPLAGATSYTATLAHPDFGTELVTDSMGNLESAEGLDGAVSYCSVRLDRHGAVMSIVYLGAIPADEGNWSRLIGLPAEVLNRLPARFKEGILPDIPAFLREPWAMALYHDRFNEFRAALEAELNDDEDYQKLIVAICSSPAYLAGKPLNPHDFEHLLPETAFHLARCRLREFIQANVRQLGTYLVSSSMVMEEMEAAAAQRAIRM